MRQRKIYAILLSVSLGLMSLPSHAALPTNSLQDGQLIQGGTYANTPGHRTQFQNSQGTGLWLKSDQNLRGIEVDAAGLPTNNGGVFYFRAPNQVVRLDGNIDLRGIQSGSGVFLGNGGRVLIDAGYLYQNGNIYAGGVNGGLIQANVGAAVFDPDRRGTLLDAMGHGGHGGIISINSSGPVDIQYGTSMKTSGNSFSQFDSNVINVEGSLVNFEGTLYADGVQSRGGTIRLVANGETDLAPPEAAIRQSPVFTQAENDAAFKRLEDLKSAHDGDVYISPNYFRSDLTTPIAFMTANGDNVSWGNSATHKAVAGNDSADLTPRAGDGGTIIISAQRDFTNGGWLAVLGGYDIGLKGGNGGNFNLSAGSSIVNTGRLDANGMNGDSRSGDGGHISLTYGAGMLNTGVISAMGATNYAVGGQGGNGGTVIFNGDQNPSGNGKVATFGGLGSINGALGTVTAADPAQSSNQIFGVWKKR